MGNEDIKLLFSANMNVHIGNPEEPTEKLQKLINEFSRYEERLSYKKYCYVIYQKQTILK